MRRELKAPFGLVQENNNLLLTLMRRELKAPFGLVQLKTPESWALA